MAPTNGVSGSDNQENGIQLLPTRRTISGQGRSLNESVMVKVNSRNPIRALKPKNKYKKRKSTNRSGPDTEDNTVTSTSDGRNPSGTDSYPGPQNMNTNKRQKVLTSPNSESVGVPRFDPLDMHYEHTIAITPPRGSSPPVPYLFTCQPESSMSLLNPVATVSALYPQFHTGSLPQHASCPESGGRVRRTFIDEFGPFDFKDQNNSVPVVTAASLIRPELPPRKSFKRRSANASLTPAKRLSKFSHGFRRASAKFNKVIDLSGICDISDEETEVITVNEDSVDETKHLPVITISEDSMDERLPGITSQVKKSVEETNLNRSFEDGELPESDDEIEIIGMHLAGGKTSTVTKIKACATPAKRSACTPKPTQRKTPRCSTRRKNRLSGLRTPGNVGGGGGNHGLGTPRNHLGTFGPITPRNRIGKLGRVKTPQQLATAAAALHVRRKSIQRYGAASLLRTPREANPRSTKPLKRLTRWESPLNTNRALTMRNTSTVSAWNERRYQQANEFNNNRRPFRRNQHTRGRDGGRGSRGGYHGGGRAQDTSRVMRNQLFESTSQTQYVKNPFSGITNRDFMPVFPGSSKDGDSSSTFLIPRNNHEQGISAFGMNMYVPLLVEQKGKPRPIIIDGSNVAMSHGNNAAFSCKGIKICVQYFKELGHETVLAFVPRYRAKLNKSIDTHILDELEKEGVLKYTPSREFDDGRQICSYDDRYIVQCAAALGGIIVSNDNFRDLIEEQPTWRTIIETKLLQFTWIIGDIIMFPPDPLGRNGPPLQEFLRF